MKFYSYPSLNYRRRLQAAFSINSVNDDDDDDDDGGGGGGGVRRLLVLIAASAAGVTSLMTLFALCACCPMYSKRRYR